MSLRGRGIFRFSKVFLKSFLDGPLGFLGEAGWFSISVVSRRADLLGFANSVSEGVAVLSRYTVKNVFADFAVCD